MNKCDTCMQELPEEKRQMHGCGHAPLPPAHLLRFVQTTVPDGYKGPRPTVCSGYTTSLPEVIEIARAHLHWSKGGVRLFERDPLHPVALGIEILEGAAGELKSWLVTPKSKGGGAEDPS